MVKKIVCNILLFLLADRLSSLLIALLHCCSLFFTVVHSSSLLFALLHCCSLLFTAVLFSSLQFSPLHYRTPFFKADRRIPAALTTTCR
jgi:hypothetical protein